MSESVQKKLLVVKPPRIKITYDIETGGATISKTLPGVFGILGDFSGMRDESKPFLAYRERQFINIDSENFNTVLKELTPRVLVPVVELDGTTVNNLELIFETINDFNPLNLVKKINVLFKIYDQKKQLSELKVKYDLNRKSNSIFDTMLTDTKIRETIQEQIAVFLGKSTGQTPKTDKAPDNNKVTQTTGSTTDKPSEVIKSTITPTTTTGKELSDLLEKLTTGTSQKQYMCGLLDTYIVTIQENISIITATTFLDFCSKFFIAVDQRISNYLNQILHNKDFQKLEGRWRGLEYVVSNMLFTSHTQLRIFNASDEELYNDLTGSMEFDQSYLFHTVYEKEYGTFGGTPYTAMMWDHALSRSSVEFSLLTRITEVFAAAHCPLTLGVDPSLFDMPSFAFLPEPHTLSHIFNSVELSDFNSFRESPDAKYVNFVIPRVMARIPYNTNETPIVGLNFVEKVNPLTEEDYTWSNAAFSRFTSIANSYATSGWFNKMCGVENGGKIDNLPLYIYKSAHGDYRAKCPTEVSITDRREQELSELGFMTLCHSRNSNYGVFFSNKNCFKSPIYDLEEATANGELSRNAHYILNVSRFAHFLKCMMRDKVGSFMNREDVASYLNNWLAQYTLLDDKAPVSIKVRYPLREFKLTVEDVPGRKGYYNAVLLLRPHDELDGIEISLRLVQKVQ